MALSCFGKKLWKSKAFLHGDQEDLLKWLSALKTNLQKSISCAWRNQPADEFE
jgi:hypothetical protein